MIIGPRLGGLVSISAAGRPPVSGLLALALIALLATGCNGSSNGRENNLAPTSEAQVSSVAPTPAAVPVLPMSPASTGPVSRTTTTPEPVVSMNVRVPQKTHHSPTATHRSPTPTLHREWTVQEIIVEGGAVTVDPHMYAAVDVRVELGDRKPDLVEWSGGTLRHVFHDVPAGRQEFVVSDVMGFSEVIELVVQGSPSGR